MSFIVGKSILEQCCDMKTQRKFVGEDMPMKACVNFQTEKLGAFHVEITETDKDTDTCV